MNRIFYFSGHRLTVFHWDRKKFHGACSFEPDSEGLSKFRHYLETSLKSPARLLVDVIEEDFRTETAPHVYGKDKKAVIDRLLDRYYRSSGHYVYSEVIGRDKTGRRDNKVLIGGITNPGLIDIWKDIIEECGIPLIGVWSLPLVSKAILPLLAEKHSAVLLVSQQVNSNLRQTFFRDGKMLSSRQSVINQDAADISNIGKFAAPEVERTIVFLRNQKLIESNETVYIHILGSDEQISSLETEFNSDELNEVFIHKLSDLQAKAGLEGLSGKFSDGLFTWLCSSKQSYQTDYGEAKEYGQYYYVLAAKALKTISVLVVLSALLITEFNVSSALEYRRSIELLGEQAAEYKNIYKKRFEAYETVFEHARSMSAAVDMADRIEQHGKTSPLDFMLELSAVLSGSGLGSVEIDKIEWNTEQYQKRPEDNKRKKKYRKENKDKVDVTIEDPVQHVAIIRGRIAISDKNYRGSVVQVNRIMTALLQHERIEKVEAMEMPVDVRSEKAFSDESGLDSANADKSSRGNFSLKVVMREPTHE